MHTEHGQEVICESRGHLVDWEMAMVSAFSGCQLRTVYADRGILTWQLIQQGRVSRPSLPLADRAISLENTHNLAGGTVMPLEVAEEIWAGAAEAGLPVHLDGARIFNAATALDIPVDQLTSGFSSVMFCLSKGLCAPVGSMLVSSRNNIERARNFRKALGGGMRQAGILAAAGLIALNEMTGRLQEDHDHAKLLAGALSKLPQVDSIQRWSRPTSSSSVFAAEEMRRPGQRSGRPRRACRNRGSSFHTPGDAPRCGSCRLRASRRDPG